jgi:imidazolonepropionase-like amidohydrolase
LQERSVRSNGTQARIASGLSAHETLAAATINAARALGRSAEIGSIEVGKAADIAVWAADPRTATLRPSDLELVLLEGRCHDPAALLDGLTSGA